MSDLSAHDYAYAQILFSGNRQACLPVTRESYLAGMVWSVSSVDSGMASSAFCSMEPRTG